MKEIHHETLIIGAGPAGMACAMELSKANKDFILVEKDSSVGGLSKTYTFTEKDGSVFYTDNGPHRFFSKNPYLYEFIGDLLKEDWITVHRQTRQFLDGKYFDYPINGLQAIKNVGAPKAIGMLVDYCLAKIQYGIFKKPITNFEEYVVANFGRTLGEFNMINYTEKIWGIPARDIHPDWAKQRIKGLNITAILKDMLLRVFGKKNNKPKTLIDTFFYPRKGTGEIYETIKNNLMQKGYEVLLSSMPQHIEKTEEGFRTVIKTGDEEIVITSKYLVESVPIVEFIKLLDKKVPDDVLKVSEKLRYRSQVYLFITLNKTQITPDQWIYFPSKATPIARVSEMKNFSDYMSPKDKTSMFVEFFCFEGDEIWNADADALLGLFLPLAKQAGFFKKEDIRECYRMAKKNVYPIYDLIYQEYLNVIKDYLNNIKGLYYIGRPGRFRYNNQDHSLEMGILAARSIIDKAPYDIESVGEEKEYFEAGDLKEAKEKGE